MPGTHNVARGLAVIEALASAGPADVTCLPRFDKATDEPVAAADAAFASQDSMEATRAVSHGAAAGVRIFFRHATMAAPSASVGDVGEEALEGVASAQYLATSSRHARASGRFWLMFWDMSSWKACSSFLHCGQGG